MVRRRFTILDIVDNVYVDGGIVRGRASQVQRSYLAIFFNYYVCADFSVYLQLVMISQMKKLWGAIYVIGETSKWANAHPDRANARYGWEKAIVLETVV